MRTVILGAAIMLAAAAPAGAQSWPGAAIGSGSAFASGGPTYSSNGPVALSGGGEHRRHNDRRRDRGFDGGVVYSGYERDYQGDSAWRANSFNDWWHERPDRAFPRWMQNNQDCERQWWGGGQWRC